MWLLLKLLFSYGNFLLLLSCGYFWVGFSLVLYYFYNFKRYLNRLFSWKPEYCRIDFFNILSRLAENRVRKMQPTGKPCAVPTFGLRSQNVLQKKLCNSLHLKFCLWLVGPWRTLCVSKMAQVEKVKPAFAGCMMMATPRRSIKTFGSPRDPFKKQWRNH